MHGLVSSLQRAVRVAQDALVFRVSHNLDG
mgnify:CR=1 FL=1